MRTLSIKADGIADVRITEEDEELVIAIFAGSRESYKRILIRCVNAGIPGVVGPDLTYNLGDLIEQTHKEAKKAASKGM